MMLVLRPRLPKSLRGTITMGIGFVGCLALVAAMLLLTLTNRLRLAGEEVAASIQSVRLLDEAEVDLLLHARSDDATVASAHESDLRHRLAVANASVTSPAEKELLSRATEAVNRYVTLSQLQSVEAAAALSVAFGALEALMEINLGQWSEAAERAREASSVASTAGITTTVVVVPLVCLLVWWIWRRAFAPLVSLGQAMERFAAGDRCARARPAGPCELGAMAERFNEMADELSRQKEAQMAFLAGIAHDLRNPLSPLKICAALLADAAPSFAGHDRSGLVRVIGRQVEQLDRMIGDLVEVSYMEAGHVELRLAKVDMLQVAGDVIELFRPVAPRHQMRLHSPQPTVWLTCDPVRVQRVLNNLVSNAIKYSPDGGAVTLALEQDGVDVAISVRDSGPGIPLRDQRRLFEPFHRAPRAVKSNIPGVGLGLYVSRRLVEAHGGSLVVNSAEGQGTTFTIRLPVLVNGQEAIEQRSSPIASAAVH
jgi:signal transduction histidine kinase